MATAALQVIADHELEPMSKSLLAAPHSMCEIKALLAKTAITFVDILGVQYPHMQVRRGMRTRAAGCAAGAPPLLHRSWAWRVRQMLHQGAAAPWLPRPPCLRLTCWAARPLPADHCVRHLLLVHAVLPDRAGASARGGGSGCTARPATLHPLTRHSRHCTRVAVRQRSWVWGWRFVARLLALTTPLAPLPHPPPGRCPTTSHGSTACVAA